MQQKAADTEPAQAPGVGSVASNRGFCAGFIE